MNNPRIFKLSIALVLMIWASFCMAEAEPEFTTQKINDHFYIIEYDFQNVGVSIGSDGVLLVDSMDISVDHQQLLNVIRRLSDKPIKYVINTHHHRDHAGGNAFFIKQGAVAIAPENVRYTNGYANNQLWFNDKLVLKFNNDDVQVHHVVHHTWADALIYFPKSNVLFTGDTHSTTWGPSGSRKGIKGQLETYDLALSLTNDQTVVVPGHGVLTDRSGLAAYRKASADWHDHVIKLHEQGLSNEDIARDKKLREIDLAFHANKQWYGKELSDDGHTRHIEILINGAVRKVIKAQTYKAFDLPKSIINSYLGRYELDDKSIVEVYLEQGELFARREKWFISPLLPRSKTKLSIIGWDSNSHFSFELDQENVVKRTKVIIGDAHHDARKLDDDKYEPPKLVLEDFLIGEINKNGVHRTVNNADKILNENGYKIRSSQLLNRMGYDFIENDQLNTAIEIFKLNIHYFPKQANLYDSLADAYERSGQNKLAHKYYKKAVAIAAKYSDKGIKNF